MPNIYTYGIPGVRITGEGDEEEEGKKKVACEKAYCNNNNTFMFIQRSCLS